MIWYSLEIIYDGETPGSIERHKIKNLSPGLLKQFRETAFTTGLYVQDPDVPSEGEIIPPARIRKMFVTMQSKKFD